MLNFFHRTSEEYRKNAVGLARVEAIYFPSITLLIGISTLVTIMIGGIYHIRDHSIDLPTIVEFVMYINMLTFPVSAIGLTASMIQRAAARSTIHNTNPLSAALCATSETSMAPRTTLGICTWTTSAAMDSVRARMKVKRWAFTMGSARCHQDLLRSGSIPAFGALYQLDSAGGTNGEDCGQAATSSATAVTSRRGPASARPHLLLGPTCLD